MRAAFVDIWNEIVDLRREVVHLSAALDRIGDHAGMDEQKMWEQTHMFASAIGKIYTGCERAMALVASDIDGTPVRHSDGWHVALLKRMANPFPEAREAVISDGCYARLDRLRAFRHRERNSYGVDLDASIVRERAEEAIVTVGCFETEVRAFMRQHGFDQP